jgi:hypothetical protein
MRRSIKSVGRDPWRSGAYQPRHATDARIAIRGLRAFLDFYDLVCNKTVRLTVNRHGSFLAWGLRKAEDPAGTFVIPVLQVLDAMFLLDFEVLCVGTLDSVGGQARDVLMNVHEERHRRFSCLFL